jgi:hypothetical protein
MKKVMMMTVVAAALGLSGCATESQNASAPAAKKASKPHIQAVFKKGSKVCKWTGANGIKGTDYFYKDVGALKGSADRLISGKTGSMSWSADLRGTWSITGGAMNLNWYDGKKGKGVWFKSAKTGKKSFDLTSFSGEKYSMKCK